MPNQPIVLFYPSDDGNAEIRTIYIQEKLYLSLEDVVRLLVKSNRKELPSNDKRSLMGLVKSQIEVLDEDEVEHFSISAENGRMEAFITEPGLYRIVSRDESPAAKKFQRWIFHEVIPSIRKYGTYPPPVARSEVSELMSLAQALAQNMNLLVREIQEREKLALETKLRFEKNERELSEVSQKIELLGGSSYAGTYMSVHDYIIKNNLKNIDHQHLWAMCKKICLEKKIQTKHTITDSGEKIFLFPPYVISDAVGML